MEPIKYTIRTSNNGNIKFSMKSWSGIVKLSTLSTCRSASEWIVFFCGEMTEKKTEIK